LELLLVVVNKTLPLNARLRIKFKSNWSHSEVQHKGIISLKKRYQRGLEQSGRHFLLEVDKPLFPSLNQEELRSIAFCLISTQSLIWVTGNNRKIPEFGDCGWILEECSVLKIAMLVFNKQLSHRRSGY